MMVDKNNSETFTFHILPCSRQNADLNVVRMHTTLSGKLHSAEMNGSEQQNQNQHFMTRANEISGKSYYKRQSELKDKIKLYHRCLESSKRAN